jgi:outer membrane protein TolC
VTVLSSLVAELRRRALGISAEEIRYTFDDVRAELRAVRAELKEDLARLRRDLGIPPPADDVEDDDVPEAKA